MSRAVRMTLITLLALSPVVATAETLQPRFPVPDHVSPAAQAILAAPIQINRTAPSNTPGAWEARHAVIEKMFGPQYESAISRTSVTITKREIAGVPVRELVPPDEKKGKVLLSLHGGAYTVMGGKFSVMEGLPLAEAGRYRVVAVDYRMPPDHPFPAAVDDGVAVYKSLLETYKPGDIVIFGASAGGGLTAAVTLAARDAGLALPAAVILNSPWSDLSKTGDSYFTNDGVDPFLPTYDPGLESSAKLYAGTESLKHPLISPVYADFSKGFPPTMLATGTRDLLLSCTVRLHREIRRAGVEAELHVFEAMWHGFGGSVPEGQELLAETLAFIEKHLGQ